MADGAFLTPILTSVVGLVGVLVAGLSVYVNYRGRHNQFRQVVYSKQMDAYFDIVAAMADLHNAAQNLIHFHGLRSPEDGGRKPFHMALKDEHEQFNEKVNRWLIVLPSKVKAALDNFDLMLATAGSPDVADAADPGQDLAKAYEQAVNSIRHHLAVDSLTKGMLREMDIGMDSLSVRNMPAGAVRLMSAGRSR
jgi:hypothetical protein